MTKPGYRGFAFQEVSGDSIRRRGTVKTSSLLAAVREGFEPSVQLPVRQFSKLVLSASQAPHPTLIFQGMQM